MKLTKEMIDNAFKLINETYHYGNSEDDVIINYNPYIAGWFANAVEKLYNIEMSDIPTKQQFLNWKQQIDRKEKLKKLNLL